MASVIAQAALREKEGAVVRPSLFRAFASKLVFMPLRALQKNGKMPKLQFWEIWRYSLLKFKTIYRALA